MAEEERNELAGMAENEEAEPWESWETKLVLYSIGIGVLVLIVGGLLVNYFLL
jgi:hypothetical protein